MPGTVEQDFFLFPTAVDAHNTRLLTTPGNAPFHLIFQVRPLEYALQQGMEFLLGTLCRFWTSLFPVHLVRLTTPMRQFVTPFLDLNY